MLQFKLVLLGDSSVGKSSIVNRFVKDTFDEFRESTIGAAFLSQSIKIKDPKTNQDVIIKFEIWDTAGQERYKSLAPMYYRNANAALVVYDITIADSLLKAKSWVNELKEKVGNSTDDNDNDNDNNNNNNLVIHLVGNKLDLVEDDPEMRSVATEDAVKYSTDENLLFKEVSAKTDFNIKEVFQTIGEKLYEIRQKELDNNNNKQNKGEINISLPRPSTNDSTSCCS